MRIIMGIWPKFLMLLYLSSFSTALIANEIELAKVVIKEPAGIARSLEYIEIQLQIKIRGQDNEELNIVAEDSQNGDLITCQVFNKIIYPALNIISLSVVFPISINGNEQKIFSLKKEKEVKPVTTDLTYSGTGLDLKIDNHYYSANLAKSNQSEAKSHDAGQLNDLLIKMEYNQLLFRTENRMHWAPSFQKQGVEYYSTSSGWDNPKYYKVESGPYLIFTQRKDLAPEHPEILLNCNYYFYSGLPYFRFYSSMDIINDVNLSLLRNDEMTMDSLFTHIAYLNNSGGIIDLPLANRYSELENNPISNNSPWVCFYNEELGYAFGSIRIKYDNTNQNGLNSPTYLPHTKISDGAEGGKYWNRILIQEHPMFVPKGSSYREENAYIVFKIDREDKFKEINYWMSVLNNSLEISVIPKTLLKERK